MTPFHQMVDAGLGPSLETDSSDTYTFLAVEEDIREINVLLTLLGGKINYKEPQ